MDRHDAGSGGDGDGSTVGDDGRLSGASVDDALFEIDVAVARRAGCSALSERGRGEAEAKGDGLAERGSHHGGDGDETMES